MRHLLISIGVGITLFVLSLMLFTTKQSFLVGVVGMLVYLWSSEALPLGVVSLLPLILFPLFGILDMKSTAPNYSKSIIFLFIGGFLLAIGMQKTLLHQIIANRLLRFFPKSARGVIYALAITSAALSAFLSNTTVTIMLVPIALFLSEDNVLKVRYLLATAYGASIGGIFTPIGTPPNLILLGFLEDWNIQEPTFLEWMGLTLPVVLGMLIIVPWILSLHLKDKNISCTLEPIHRLTKEQKKLLWILGTLVMLLLVNAVLKPLFGWSMNEKMLLLGFGVLLFLPGIDILQWSDTKEMPYEIVFLFGAGFAIAKAFIQTGLAESIAKEFAVFSGLSLPLLLFVIALFVSFATEITSNTALTSIILPILYTFGQQSHLPTPIILFTATIAASYAFMLPIATPPNAIVMSSRVIKIKEMARIGFWINLLGVILVTAVATTIWRLYFG
ncbi:MULTISPECIES: DASS family sodium-coupled anion symporter [unclassified Nitratiruptor]|uniref:SLC13 family permease n=1 Tax=unclassified Nitratiruptor TaxID=2624044 RepID=UPI001915CBAF|nr:MULTISPECIES: DASS family sodium-coupled anion symporter [unclassified Nitratiruptor]BCD60119.1 solute carrier family 13, member 2/3/5 [Nitratiruptor sp. YY08-10]BCD64392.1 solute carrier family 13, member 2/3/5 [Nitratiruptor sp. YY08-14]